MLLYTAKGSAQSCSLISLQCIPHAAPQRVPLAAALARLTASNVQVSQLRDALLPIILVPLAKVMVMVVMLHTFAIDIAGICKDYVRRSRSVLALRTVPCYPLADIFFLVVGPTDNKQVGVGDRLGRRRSTRSSAIDSVVNDPN